MYPSISVPMGPALMGGTWEAREPPDPEPDGCVTLPVCVTVSACCSRYCTAAVGGSTSPFLSPPARAHIPTVLQPKEGQ